MSGTGKSWAVADWTTRVLHGRVRLLIPGADLDRADRRTLAQLVALRLRPFNSAPVSDEDVLAKLRAVALIEGKGPLVIVVDDLMPTGDIMVFRRDLSQLAAQCRSAGMKLVLTCQTHVWDFYRLGQGILPGDIYRFDPGTPEIGPDGTPSSSDQIQDGEHLPPPSLFSFVLPDLTPEEQESALVQRLPSDVAERVIHLLRAPAFAPLRRPYLLELYLEQHKKHLRLSNVDLVPVDIDTLLDTRLEMLLLRVATLLNADEHDVQEAFDALQQLLRVKRPDGLATAEAVMCLERYMPECGSTALDALRQVGVLTAKGRVRVAEATLADRIFARALREQYIAGKEIVSELRLEDDPGVVSALLRSLAHENPVSLAESLLVRDPRWTQPVAEGLAQCSSQDYRVLAFLTVLTRFDEGAIGLEGCDALGQLAARGHRKRGQVLCGQRAFEWITQFYLSSRRANRLRGGRALSALLDLAPGRAERVMRLRLARTARMGASSRSNHEKRDDWLRDALLPLLNINHSATARVGERILAHYKSVIGLETGVLDDRILQEIDEARGSIALFLDDEMERLSIDLQAPDPETRGHAALALRSVMFEKPERMQAMICEAIRRETDGFVMNRLLWSTYRLTELVPDALLDALAGTFAIDWSTPSPATGQALASLANLALQIPERVMPLLPQRLEVYPAWSRAWLSEGLVFAWWTCAERLPEARGVFAHLAVPDVADVPGEFQLLALRGAVIAQLGLLCLGVAPVKDLQGRQSNYPRSGMQFLYVNTIDFVRTYASDILAQPGAEQLLDLLVRCLIEEQRAAVHPIAKPLFAAHGVSASLCVEMLVSLAIVHPDPVSLLRGLPSNWRLVYAVRRFLESGRKEPHVIEFARALCEAPSAGRTTQELGERKRLLVQLARLSQTPTAVLQELREMTFSSPFTADDHAGAIAELADENRGDMLDLLAQTLESEDDLAVLYQWVAQTRSWQGLLVTRVYVRMFDASPIRRVEAYELCQQMLAAVGALPPSTSQQEYLAVYGAIASMLEGVKHPAPILPPSNASLNALSRSHAYTLELLLDMPTESAGEQRHESLVDTLAAAYGRGWWTKTGVYLEGDSVGVGTSRSIAYVFPAVRLALIAIESTGVGIDGARDPAAQFLRERATISDILSEHALILDPRIARPSESLERTLAALENLGTAASRDVRVGLHRGLLLLRLGRLREAELELQRGLAMPSCTADTRASVLYNLACVYARTDREDLCCTTLQEAIALWPSFCPNVQDDPDFTAVRESLWFRKLCE
jgi:hypothetical protein